MSRFQINVSNPGQAVGVYEVEVAGQMVIITERPDNPGPSITNNAERVINELVRTRPDVTLDSIFVEHYPKRGEIKETFDLIRPVVQNGTVVSVSWKHLSLEDFYVRREQAATGVAERHFKGTGVIRDGGLSDAPVRSHRREPDYGHALSQI